MSYETISLAFLSVCFLCLSLAVIKLNFAFRLCMAMIRDLRKDVLG